MTWADLHRFYFMLVEASLWLTVAQLKLVYVYYMRAAADNMVMYNYNLSTALVVATQTITPQAIVSSNAVSATVSATATLQQPGLGFAAAATSPDKKTKGGKGKGGKGNDRVATSGSRRSRSRSPVRSHNVPHRSEVCEAFNFDRRGCSGCRKLHRCLKCNSREHGQRACRA